MALTYTSVGTHAAASGASPAVIASSVALNIGDYLLYIIAYDNSGGGGANPVTVTGVTAATGSLAGGENVQSGLNDPGAASVGLASSAQTFMVASNIPSGTNISLAWAGTMVVRACVMVKVSSTVPGGSVVFRVTGGGPTNTVASAAPSFVTASVNTGELVLCYAGHENGANITGDADVTNGAWGTMITTFNGAAAAGMAAGLQGKTVTATATQTFNPTGTSSDWIIGSYIYTEVLPPVYPNMQPRIAA